MVRKALSTLERALQASTARSAPMSPAPRLVRTTRAVEPGLAASVGRLQQLADVGGPEVLEDARGGGHAAVADQGDAGDAEAGAQL
ncbi:MAG: hypothetical protein OXI87_23205 [Albidovulum sp.]|nr:hypothetical protein [Albidovulum sp.]